MPDRTIDLDSHRSPVSLAQTERRRLISADLPLATAPRSARAQYRVLTSPRQVREPASRPDAEWAEICARAEALLRTFSRSTADHDHHSQLLIRRLLRDMAARVRRDGERP